MKDAMQQVNELTIENTKLESKVVMLQLEIERMSKELKPLRKAYLELLEEAMHYRERMGFDHGNFEYDWMEKGGLL